MPRCYILYVEDDDSAFALFQMVLEETDPSVQLCRASDGDQALALLQNSVADEQITRPDLILLDINLPGKNGFEILRILKRTESLRSIPVIMFTTSADRNDRDNSLALGAHEFVTKPPTLDRLVEFVKAFTRLPYGPSEAAGPQAAGQ